MLQLISEQTARERRKYYYRRDDLARKIKHRLIKDLGKDPVIRALETGSTPRKSTARHRELIALYKRLCTFAADRSTIRLVHSESGRAQSEYERLLNNIKNYNKRMAKLAKERKNKIGGRNVK